jgi:hypothetical protein
MTPAQFLAKWSQAELSEKQAAQQHFLDLCELVGHPKPAEADPTGEWFCFEKGAAKRDGGDGWADVWKKDFFGWEYKGKRKDLAEAYRQLDGYRAALENPPLLVVCDLDRIEVHTNFTSTKPQQFIIPLAQLDTPRHLEILRAVFHEPDKLKPGVPSAAITEEAAAKLGSLADTLRQRGLEPTGVAHFLIRVVFCLFAKDVGLLPKAVFTQILDKCRPDPARFQRLLRQLWTAMADGGDFGAETIRHFNGNLFQNETVPALTVAEIQHITAAAALEWNTVDASIFGTLFTRGIDPSLRSQLGAQYTSRADALFTDWPEVDFLVGNPPFLGGKITRTGLLATQGIRGGANRAVLKRLKETGDIFFAESDRDWIQDGANVHVSMIGFDNGAEKTRQLDGQTVAAINANLTATADITEAQPIPANLNLSFMGTTKGGAFDIPEQLAVELLTKPNPHGKPNSDVVVPWVNGLDVTRRPRGMWIIDFGVGLPEQEAAKYEAPFEYVREHVKPDRDQNNRESYRRLWWQQVEARPKMRAALASLPRFLTTITVSKYRLFTWMTAPVQADHQLFAFARSDDYFFGVLHSRVHEVWALKLGTRLETRPRYTPTTCFETFPFPAPTDAQHDAIAGAARELNELRERWLNPPEWTREETLEFPASVAGPWKRYIVGRECPKGFAPFSPETPAAGNPSGVPALQNQIGLARYPRLVPKDAACAAKLKKRTLTNLYKERPTWLAHAHAKLDAAVFAAYGWPDILTDDDVLERLLKLNHEQSHQ